MAVSRLHINGVANMSDPAVIEQMRRRYPYRKRRLPVTGEKKQCLDGLGGLKDDLKGLERSVAPRIGGLRNQYLVVLTEKMTQYQMELLESNGRKYLLLADHSKESQIIAPHSPSISNLASTIPAGAFL